MKNLKFILGGFISLYLAWITGTGEILNYIPFADPLNEMGFFILCCMMSTGFFMCIERKKVNNLK
jgi:hypothetical protein|tara:strand:- start:81 stop:275 length:195 start_codon:yes stop_codon:yes gene_type:complete